MATIHLNTTGSNTSPYDTWAKAATTWATAVTGMVAGDVLAVDSAYTTLAAGINLTFPGTPANPNIILSGTPGVTSGLTAIVQGAICGSSTTTHVVSGSFIAKGVIFRSTSASSHDANFGTSSGNTIVLDNCTTEMTGAGGSSTYVLGATGSGVGSHLILRNHGFKLGSAAQYFNINMQVDVDGGSLLAGGTSPTNMFYPGASARTCQFTVQGLDLTNASAGINICNAPYAGATVCTFRDIKTPASWSGALVGTLKAGNRFEMWNGGNGNTNYSMKILDYTFTANENTSIYVTGTTVAAQAMSIKVDTTANCSRAAPAQMALLPVLVDQSSGTYTVTAEIARDGSSTAYLDSEVWLEVEYLGTTTSTLGVMADDACDILTQVNSGGTAQTTSTTPWTGLGGTNITQKCVVTITPKKPGYILPRICFAKPSSTFYVDPGVTVA